MSQLKRSIFLTFLFLSLPVIAEAQTGTAPEAASLLYQVSGKDLVKPSYIFGTFHAICEGEMVPFETLDPYLDKTDQLMMEIDLDDAAEMQTLRLSVVIPEGKTLRDFLTTVEFAKVDDLIKDLLGYSAENLKTLRPSLIMVTALTSRKAIGCTPNVYDISLMQKASAKRKPIVGLETVAEQIKALDSKPLGKQAKELYEMALNPQKSIDDLKRMMAIYKMRDAEKLFEFTNSQMVNDKEFQMRLLDERNSAWIPKLEAAFKRKPTFVAVGAGHLGGKNGVVGLLLSKGYRVTPVRL